MITGNSWTDSETRSSTMGLLVDCCTKDWQRTFSSTQSAICHQWYCGSARELVVMEVPAARHRDVLGNSVDNGKSRQTSWLYQCMVSDCSCTFERLADLRVHFVDQHQSGNQFLSCCVTAAAAVNKLGQELAIFQQRAANCQQRRLWVLRISILPLNFPQMGYF